MYLHHSNDPVRQVYYNLPIEKLTETRKKDEEYEQKETNDREEDKYLRISLMTAELGSLTPSIALTTSLCILIGTSILLSLCFSSMRVASLPLDLWLLGPWSNRREL